MGNCFQSRQLNRVATCILTLVCFAALPAGLEGAIQRSAQILPGSQVKSSLAVSRLTSPRDDEDSPDQKRERNEQTAQLLANVLDHIEANYVDEVDRDKLLEAALEGIMAELDQHSSYIPPSELGQFRGSIDNAYGGIGVQVSLENEEMRVISPFFGSPAYNVGIMAGDVILSIEGESTVGMPLSRAAELTTGEVGTKIKLSIRRAADQSVQEFVLQRAVIKMETVLGTSRQEDESWEYLLGGDRKIAHVRLTGFGRTTAYELKQTLVGLQAQGMEGLILDLRFNPGGLLSAAIQISDLFVSEGKIVSTESRNHPPRVWNATEKSTLPEFPMVVLVNQFSASASEILAACLKDHDRAIVIGQRTFGKGSVQNVVPLNGGTSALKLTTATYFRPNGRNIHRSEDDTEEDEWGVEPSNGFEVILSDEEIATFIRDRRRRDVVGAATDQSKQTSALGSDGNATSEDNAKLEGAAKSGDDAPRPPRPAEPKFRDQALDQAIEYLETALNGKGDSDSDRQLEPVGR